MLDNQNRPILCPRCRKLISADEPHCPHCGLRAPGAWLNSERLTGLLRDPDRLLRAIVYLNAGMFILSLLLNPRLSAGGFNPLGFLSPDSRILILLGATGTIPIDTYGVGWWSLLAANYLHGGLLHILFNMMALRQIAPLVIDAYGPYRMVTLYTLSGVLGFALSYLAGIPLTIGASAAVCGLIGCALYYARSRGGAYGQALYRQLGGWALGIFVFGFIVPGINNWGHGGGLFGGALVGWLLGYNEKRAESLRHRVLAGSLAALTVAVLGFAALRGTYFRFF